MDELDKLRSKFDATMTAIRNARPKVLDDFPDYEDLPELMPDLAYHYLYGGWFDLRGILVISRLSERHPTDEKNVLLLPAPAPLSTDTFLHKKTAFSILTEARKELIRCLSGVYLLPVGDRFQARPFMHMGWKDITPESRLIALHYNSHVAAEAQSSEQPHFSRISYDWPSGRPFPAASLLVQQHPEMLWRLSQFGGARDMVLNGTRIAKERNGLWNSLVTLNTITVTLLAIAVTQSVLTICFASMMVKKIKQGKRKAVQSQESMSTDAESSLSVQLSGFRCPAMRCAGHRCAEDGTLSRLL
eukprot:GHVS01007006.1.p1 GENE.GHVS01007006.1~~GHVS01007006.1.p1  ORF type:complete len:351 (+),score=29.59 GHVS01007006.1:150-1055(+)